MSFLESMQVHSEGVLRYEDKDLQKKALEMIPVEELERSAVKDLRALQKDAKRNKIQAEEIPEIRDLLLLKLLTWFRECFFIWVDAPDCKYCKGDTTFLSRTHNHNLRVEIYACNQCHRNTEFVRYNDPGKLLETRKGRCGEWANCFTLLCRAMGWDARHVVDVTDHAWTEVYSVGQERWLHCDPCENICDNPLVYEEGWGKKLSYVMAYSYDDIQDVTWRYTRHHQDVMSRRNQCSETDLLLQMIVLRNERQQNLSRARRDYILRRLVIELVELMSPQKMENKEYEGRTSGSLAWRLVRGEAGPTRPIKGHVWQPTISEVEERTMHILYSCAQDMYIRPLEAGRSLKHWEEGVYEASSIIRKEEKDWKMVYLSRREGHSQGFLRWKVDCGDSGLVIDWLKLCCRSTVFQSGKVHLEICAGDMCMQVPAGDTFFETKELSGYLSFTLTAYFNGGDGEVAWQHAQLFRQSAKDLNDFPLSIVVTLKQ